MQANGKQRGHFVLCACSESKYTGWKRRHLSVCVSDSVYGQCWRCHVVAWQWIISDISVVRNCRHIWSLCSESNNTNLLLHPLIAVLGTSILYIVLKRIGYTIQKSNLRSSYKACHGLKNVCWDVKLLHWSITSWQKCKINAIWIGN